MLAPSQMPLYKPTQQKEAHRVSSGPLLGVLKHIVSLITLLLMKNGGFATLLALSHAIGKWWGLIRCACCQSCVFAPFHLTK